MPQPEVAPEVDEVPAAAAELVLDCAAARPATARTRALVYCMSLDMLLLAEYVY